MILKIIFTKELLIFRRYNFMEKKYFLFAVLTFFLTPGLTGLANTVLDIHCDTAHNNNTAIPDTFLVNANTILKNLNEDDLCKKNPGGEAGEGSYSGECEAIKNGHSSAEALSVCEKLSAYSWGLTMTCFKIAQYHKINKTNAEKCLNLVKNNHPQKVLNCLIQHRTEEKGRIENQKLINFYTFNEQYFSKNIPKLLNAYHLEYLQPDCSKKYLTSDIHKQMRTHALNLKTMQVTGHIEQDKHYMKYSLRYGTKGSSSIDENIISFKCETKLKQLYPSLGSK